MTCNCGWQCQGTDPECEGTQLKHSGGGSCLTYFITGNAGTCVMLPVWRWIGHQISSVLSILMGMKR
jgi:hypothetical protein